MNMGQVIDRKSFQKQMKYCLYIVSCIDITCYKITKLFVGQSLGYSMKILDPVGDNLQNLKSVSERWLSLQDTL